MRSDVQEELRDSDEYAEYILANYDGGERVICNGHTLLLAQEDGYLFDEFCNARIK